MLLLIFSFLFLSEHILYLGSQCVENIVIWSDIVLRTFFLVLKRDVDKRHQRYGMVTLASLKYL